MNSILTITNLTKDDNDFYTCKARNQLENMSLEAEAEEFINIIGKFDFFFNQLQIIFHLRKKFRKNNFFNAN